MWVQESNEVGNEKWTWGPYIIYQKDKHWYPYMMKWSVCKGGADTREEAMIICGNHMLTGMGRSGQLTANELKEIGDGKHE